MNKYLPKKEDLKPITNDKTTFYECGFNEDFDKLPFQQKLQVVNDLVRQTILTYSDPDPNTELETLTGNCHTAALASIDYLKYLNLGKNHRYVLCKGRQYDPDDVASRHAAVLVDDDDGNTYLFDATPFVGYKMGTVTNLSQEQVFKEYEVIDDDKFELLFLLRDFMYKSKNARLSPHEINFYRAIIEEADSQQIFKGTVARCYKMLSKLADNVSDRDAYMLKSFQLNPYSRYNPDKTKIQKDRNPLILKQVAKWQEELNDLLRSNKNPKRQLELAQNIYQELKMVDGSYEKTLQLDGKTYMFSGLTPRFFKEQGLNTIIIKPSAYFLGVRGTIREAFLKRGNGALSEYFVNIASPTEITKIKPLIFSHTLGETCSRSYSGTSDVILLREKAKKIYTIKKRLRAELGKNLTYREVVWTDGEKLLWHPFETNLIHSTDNPSEANMHYLIGYPEHQVMTRFMYPNSKLEEENENDRV